MKKFILCSLVTLVVQHQVYAMEGNKKAVAVIEDLQEKGFCQQQISDNKDEQFIIYKALYEQGEVLLQKQEKENKALKKLVAALDRTKDQQEKFIKGFLEGTMTPAEYKKIIVDDLKKLAEEIREKREKTFFPEGHEENPAD